jgi:metal-responsive CopG/Arc/MetJ family transcriptional regulator
MANSPLVSIRIPPETLVQLDELAEKLYPSRKTGGKPNRSQVILDAITNFLAEKKPLGGEELEIEEKVNQILEKYQKHLEKEIQSYIDEKFLAYSYNLEQRLRYGGKLIK